MKVLFICSQNKLRSPTAEAVFAAVPGLEVSSAGTDADAEMQVSLDLLEWADIVMVMEIYHRKRLQAMFGRALQAKEPVVLGIRDNYEFMDPELIRVLKVRVPQRLRLKPEQMAALEG